MSVAVRRLGTAGSNCEATVQPWPTAVRHGHRQQMEMVAHQHVRMHGHVEPVALFAQQIQHREVVVG